MNNKNLKCPICFDNFNENEVEKYSCNHITCKECNSKILDNKCPMCRIMLSGSNEKGYWIENSRGDLVWKLRENHHPVITTRGNIIVRERRNLLNNIIRSRIRNNIRPTCIIC